MQEQPLKVTLPGEMYQRTGRWWWRVKLPGENKAKARPLKAPGTAEAACDPDTAEKLALEMWEQAVRQTGTRQITLDCTQKVERLKAQFLDKIRQLTEIVESANAKAGAEAQARAEIEARLNALIQAAGQQATVLSEQTHGPAIPQSREQTIPVDARPDVTEPVGCAVHTDNLETGSDTRTMKTDFADTMREAHPLSAPTAAEAPIVQTQTGTCECCGDTEVPVPDLAPIDSGQLLCPNCLTALHIDISRIESDAFSGSHA